MRGAVSAGALTGLAIVAIVWGAALAWPSGDAPQNVAGAESTFSARVSAPTASSPRSSSPRTTEPSAATQFAEPSSAPSPPPPSVPPVRATVQYEVAAMGTVKGDIEAFAKEVAQILGDARGWPAAGVAFERVESGGQITVWLTEPSQVPSFSGICSANLSCSIDRNIIINETRWNEGALPGVADDVPIGDYRAMVVNHEVGHWLGHHAHSPCPGAGQLAPLMMQQSKGLDGCVFNPYPLPEELTAPDLFR